MKNAALKNCGEFSAAEQRASICEVKELSPDKNSTDREFIKLVCITAGIQ
jgi:hypothetical protein